MRKKVVNNVDHKEVLADIIELKGFSEEAENLLLNMLYKIDENYDNYAKVKREVPSKEDFIQKIIVNIRDNVKNVNFVSELQSLHAVILHSANSLITH